MEFTNTPRDIPPHRPTPGGDARPMPQRRVFSDFAARPAVRPAAPPTAMPVQPTTSSPPPTHAAHAAPAHAAQPAQPISQLRQPVPAAPSVPPVPIEPDVPLEQLLDHDTKSKAPRARNTSGHAGLVGFICFVVFAALLLSPFLPGKILDNFPGSSQSESNGDQTIGCVDDVTNSTTSLAYNTRAGSPIVYNYSATSTQKALCDGQQKTAVEGRTSQFNPLGLAADLLLALAVSIGVSFLWRKLFGARD